MSDINTKADGKVDAPEIEAGVSRTRIGFKPPIRPIIKPPLPVRDVPTHIVIDVPTHRTGFLPPVPIGDPRKRPIQAESERDAVLEQYVNTTPSDERSR